MIKPVNRPVSSSTIDELKEHCLYIEDPNHKDHRDKRVGKAKNYNCPNQTADSFIDEVQSCNKRLAKIEKARGQKKKTKRVFEEVIFAPACRLTAQERDIIEQRIVQFFEGQPPIRTNWHIDKLTGHPELHVLTSAATKVPPTKVFSLITSNTRNIYTMMHDLDDEIARTLNLSRGVTPEKGNYVLSARETKKANLKKGGIIEDSIEDALEKMIAASKLYESGLAGKPELLKKIIEQKKGFQVPRQTDQTISIIWPGKQRARKYNKADLVAKIDYHAIVISLQQRHPKPASNPSSLLNQSIHQA